MQQRVDEIEEKIGVKDILIESLTKDVSKWKGESQRLKNENLDFEKREFELKKQLQLFENERLRMNFVSDQIEEQTNDLKEEIEQFRNEIAEKDDAIEHAQKNLDDFRQQYVLLKRTLDEAVRGQQEERTKRVNIEIQLQKNELSDERKRAAEEATREQIADIRTQIRELEEELRLRDTEAYEHKCQIEMLVSQRDEALHREAAEKKKAEDLTTRLNEILRSVLDTVKK